MVEANLINNSNMNHHAMYIGLRTKYSEQILQQQQQRPSPLTMGGQVEGGKLCLQVHHPQLGQVIQGHRHPGGEGATGRPLLTVGVGLGFLPCLVEWQELVC